MNPSTSDFGAAVKKLRLSLSMSQEELAEKAGLDRTYVSSLERGHRNPTLTTIIRVAEALGVEPHVLVAMMKESASARSTANQAKGK